MEDGRGKVHRPGERPPAPTQEELLATAQRFLGVPYLWGGCSPWGLDCSGFVQLVYRLHGISLPRDAHEQALAGEPVPVTSSGDGTVAGLSGGEAVFFHSEAPPHRISHVALALGAEAFIHALGSDRVRIDPWAGSPLLGRVAAARRYLPASCPGKPGGGPA
jgi:gamma-D-glutamyl-L-lysine dipeptidyl-peptidase